MMTKRRLIEMIKDVPDNAIVFIPVYMGKGVINVYPLKEMDVINMNELDSIMGDRMNIDMDYENETALENLAKVSQAPLLMLIPYNEDNLIE